MGIRRMSVKPSPVPTLVLLSILSLSAALPDPAKVLDAYLREAIAEIKVAYNFDPNSYTYRMQACGR
jgi:hypothetical protein